MKKNLSKLGNILLSLSTLHFYLKYRKAKTTKLQRATDNRYRVYFSLISQWLKNHQEQKYMSEYFSDKNIKTIAIYGMGSLEELFYQEIKDSDLEIVYAVDQIAEAFSSTVEGFPVVLPEEIAQQPEVDAVIVTPVFDYDDICLLFEDIHISAEIISLEDIIFYCAEKE